MLNLLKNALEATPQKGFVKLTTKYNEDKKEAYIIVEDNGVGMDGKTQEQLYKPYFTTKNTGTGIGLPISYRNVIAHKGEIKVQSILGEGSLFKVILPNLHYYY